MELVCDHVVETGDGEATGDGLGAEKADARRVRVGVAEDAKDVNLAQMGDAHWQRLDGRAHANHDDLATGPRRIEARVHAHFLARALERDVDAVVLVVVDDGHGCRGRLRQGYELRGEQPGGLELAIDGPYAGRRQHARLRGSRRSR